MRDPLDPGTMELDLAAERGQASLLAAAPAAEEGPALGKEGDYLRPPESIDVRQAGLQVVQTIDPETGEIVTHETRGSFAKSVQDAEAVRVARFALLDRARDVLGIDFPVWRCHRFARGDIQIFHSPAFGRAHFVGLVTCGSIWTCPVCAAKISSRRASDLQASIKTHQEAGGGLLMVTLTVPHSASDDLSNFVDRFSAALAGLHAHRRFKTLSAAFEFVGHVRAIEVTFSHVSGWHVHTHQLIFSRIQPDPEPVSLALLPLWRGEATRAGFGTPSRRGVHVRAAGLGAGAYFSKWGAASELSAGPLKKGRGSSLTPFQLLQGGFDREFRDFARVFSASRGGRKKGVAQLAFSRGLNKHLKSLGLRSVEKTDEELAAEHTAKARPIGSISAEDFELLKASNNLGAVLAAARQGFENVEEFIFNQRKVA